ncbi:hypothetical protein quinque_005460 [Culex quinquefasciatus]
MKTEAVKNVWRKLGLELAERSIYNICSAYCLLILLKNWKTTQSYQLWFVDVQSSSTLWWTFVAAHILSWVVVYAGSLLMDLPEMIGLKQIYYDVNDLAPPMSYKSRELRSLYNRMRHPSFVGLSVVLWITNCMSLDFNIVKDHGNVHHWQYSVEYTERLSHWPYSKNVALGHFSVRKLPEAEGGQYSVASTHKTCFLLGLFCLNSEGEFKISYLNEHDTYCQETVKYQCPFLFGRFCRREVEYQRTAIMGNLQKHFKVKTH